MSRILNKPLTDNTANQLESYLSPTWDAGIRDKDNKIGKLSGSKVKQIKSNIAKSITVKINRIIHALTSTEFLKLKKGEWINNKSVTEKVIKDFNSIKEILKENPTLEPKLTKILTPELKVLEKVIKTLENTGAPLVNQLNNEVLSIKKGLNPQSRTVPSPIIQVEPQGESIEQFIEKGLRTLKKYQDSGDPLVQTKLYELEQNIADKQGELDLAEIIACPGNSTAIYPLSKIDSAKHALRNRLVLITGKFNTEYELGIKGMSKGLMAAIEIKDDKKMLAELKTILKTLESEYTDEVLNRHQVYQALKKIYPVLEKEYALLNSHNENKANLKLNNKKNALLNCVLNGPKAIDNLSDSIVQIANAERTLSEIDQLIKDKVVSAQAVKQEVAELKKTLDRLKRSIFQYSMEVAPKFEKQIQTEKFESVQSDIGKFLLFMKDAKKLDFIKGNDEFDDLQLSVRRLKNKYKQSLDKISELPGGDAPQKFSEVKLRKNIRSLFRAADQIQNIGEDGGRLLSYLAKGAKNSAAAQAQVDKFAATIKVFDPSFDELSGTELLDIAELFIQTLQKAIPLKGETLEHDYPKIYKYIMKIQKEKVNSML